LRRFGSQSEVIYRKPPEELAEPLIYYGEPALVSAVKAESELAWIAPVGRERAMQITLEWAKYARVLPDEGVVR
jgi:hypothetical protein